MLPKSDKISNSDTKVLYSFFLNCVYKYISLYTLIVVYYQCPHNLYLINVYFRYFSTNLHERGADFVRLYKSKYVAKIQKYFVTKYKLSH